MRKAGKGYIVLSVAAAICLAVSVALYFHGDLTVAVLCASFGTAISLAAGLTLYIGVKSPISKNSGDSEHIEQSAVYKQEELLQMQREETSRFRSQMSHELRIPISIILGYADLLQSGIVTDEQTRNEYLSKICNRIQYMNKLLSQLLMESYTQMGMPGGIFEKTDIVDLLHRIAGDVEAVARKQNVSINVQSSEDTIYVNGDHAQLTKIFYNILENSLKYMGREGQINIIVSNAEKGWALLVFKDDGTGMDSAETEHIFELNYQGSNRKSGDGLGLHLVQTGVAAHGGTVSARSKPDGGMSIIIKLPIANNDEKSTVSDTK